MGLSNSHQHKHRVLFVLVGMLLVLLAPAANAVTKHLSMVGEDGQPMVNTTITITFPDGTKEKEDTDDKGILKFNFSKSGAYTLSDPAGNVIKTVSIAGSGMSTTAMIITGAAVIGGIALLASGSGDDSNSDGTPTDPPVTEPPVTEPPEDGGETEESQAGIYDVNLSVASNPGDEPVLLQQLVLQLEIIGTALTITQLSGDPNFPGQLTGTIADTSFTASASGVYSESTTIFQMAGSVTASPSLNFILNVGADGSLPGGQTITYNGTGTRQ
ncbi:MAG: hypothetical protein WBM38_09065 [Arenicellales bacterium]|jgi:hypothetical protein